MNDDVPVEGDPIPRADARAADARRRKRKSFHDGPFCGRCRDMLESAAFDVLSRAALKIMAKLEVAHSHAMGRSAKGRSNANGKIVCTYRALENCGVHKHVIAPAIRELVALGFVEITHRGVGGNADYRDPTLYRLTFLPTEFDGPTHEWRKFETVEDAVRAAELARAAADTAFVARGKKQIFAPTFCPVSTPLSGGGKQTSPPPLSGGSGPPQKVGVVIDLPPTGHLDLTAGATGHHAPEAPRPTPDLTGIGHNDNLGERPQARSSTSPGPKYRAVAGSIDLQIDGGGK